jgi:hypothetical protein
MHLKWAVAIGWIAWLISAVFVWIVYRWRVMHPHFLPLVSLLVVQIIAAAAALVFGVWRVLRGPRRWSAFGYLLLGTGPVWLWAGHMT